MKRRSYVAGAAGATTALLAGIRFGGLGAGVLPSMLTGDPGPPRESDYEGVDVPGLPGRDDQTRWFHDPSTDADAYLQPDGETIALPGEIEFDFVNRSSEPAEGNPYYWRVYKLVDGTWYPIYPGGWDHSITTVPPNSVDETTLHCAHGRLPSDRDGRTVGHLGGGRYAYTVDYSLDSETHAALFDVEAPSVSVDVASEATVSNDGDRRVVTGPAYADASERVVVTVSRTASAADRVIDEQLLNHQFPVLRNAVPLFEASVERVEVRTSEYEAGKKIGWKDGASRRVSYDGQAFEATVQFE